MINKKYIEKNVLKAAALHFAQHQQIQLLDFLTEETLKKIKAHNPKKILAPDKFSFSSCALPALNFSEELRILISFITKQQLKITEMSFKAFEHGDYTLLYDDLNQSGILALLDVSSWKEEWGGYTSFVADNEVFRLVPQKNSLFIVNHDGLKHFVKYVNHHAKGKRFFVEMWLNGPAEI